MGKTSHLNQVGQIRWREGKKEGRKKKEEEKKEEEKTSEKLLFLSRIQGDRTVGLHRRRRQSSSMRRELPVGTRI